MNGEPPPPARSGVFARGALPARMARLALKELREILRDQRTIVTLVLMPILVYPLLSVAFQRFLLSSLRPPSEMVYRVAVESEHELQLISPLLFRGEFLLNRHPESRLSPRDPPLFPPPDAHVESESRDSPGDESSRGRSEPNIRVSERDDIERAIADLDDDVAIRVRRIPGADPLPDGRRPLDVEILSLENSLTSREAAAYLERLLRAANDEAMVLRLKELGEEHVQLPATIQRKFVTSTGSSQPVALSALVPLILILMTITGAVYPAIDLTAGERERGTLETLIAAPVPRLGLLLAKYVAVVTVALLTATVNLTAMLVTTLSIGIAPLIFGERGLSFVTLAQVFALTILFAAFFSAVLLAVTSFARSFKEAQAYLIPLMLLSIAPGLLSIVPGVSLSGALTVVPLVNIVLLARDLLDGTATRFEALVVVLSTLLFAFAAITVAAKVFGTDAVLYGSPGNWSDLVRRPPRSAPAPTLSSGLLCLALMFPAYFLLVNLLARYSEASFESQLAAQAAGSLLLFAGIPLAAAWWRRLDFRETFSLRLPRLSALLAGALLGLSLWPFVFELVVLTHRLGVVSLDDATRQWATKLIARLDDLSPAMLLLLFAVLPAVVEEMFFRGYLFRALRAGTRPWQAIFASAVLFGLFHLIVKDALAIERLLPSTLLGIVLGWVCWRTGSLLPGIVLHACNNGTLLLLTYYRREIAARGWGIEPVAQTEHLPATWLAVASFGIAAGLALLFLTRPHPETNNSKSHE